MLFRHWAKIIKLQVTPTASNCCVKVNRNLQSHLKSSKISELQSSALLSEKPIIGPNQTILSRMFIQTASLVDFPLLLDNFPLHFHYIFHKSTWNGYTWFCFPVWVLLWMSQMFKLGDLKKYAHHNRRPTVKTMRQTRMNCCLHHTAWRQVHFCNLVLLQSISL